MSRAAQGITLSTMSGVLLALHWAGLLTIPSEAYGPVLTAWVAGLGWTTHGMIRRVPRGDYARRTNRRVTRRERMTP